MNTNPKISIIVPVYNVEKYLDRCMQSLLNQTLKDIEIIMVDDGSPDNCPMMCDEYAKKDSRIKVIHKKNAGLGYARNSGIEVATGEFVAFVDSDDYVDLEMYETLFNAAKRYYADTVYCGFYKMYSHRRVAPLTNVSEIHQYKNDEVINLMLDFIASDADCKRDWKYEMSVWHSIYSLKIIKDNCIKFKSEREILSEDLPFQILYLKNSKNVIYLPTPMYYYCMNNTNSLTHSTYDESKLQRTILLFNFLKKETSLIDINSNRSKRFLICYLRALLYGITDSEISLRKKLYFVKNLNSSEVWEKVDGYPFQALNFTSYILSWLQRKRFNLMALIFSKCILYIHKLFN